MSYKARLFWIIWTLGILGVLSFLLVDLSTILKALPPADPPVELPPPALLKVASIIQPAIFTTLAVLAGVFLASKVGLHAPAVEAAARRQSLWEHLRPQVIPGMIAGIVTGFALVLTWVVAKPFFTTEFISRAESFNAVVPHIVRFLYGGLTEEILLRWGVMTVMVWVFWRVFERDRAQPSSVSMIIAILLSAVLFGVGHLPIASLLNGGLTVPIVTYVIIGNSMFGLVAGFLYWKKGLEAAIIAHICAHVVLITAIFFAL